MKRGERSEKGQNDNIILGYGDTLGEKKKSKSQVFIIVQQITVVVFFFLR